METAGAEDVVAELLEALAVDMLVKRTLHVEYAQNKRVEETRPR